MNEPLRYTRRVSIKQIGVLLTYLFPLITKQNIQLPLRPITVKGEGKFWIASLPIGNVDNKTSDNVLLVLEDLTGKILIYNSNQQLLAIVNVGDNMRLNGHSIRIADIISSTGLQIKSDPGIPLVYFGFSFLMLSIVLSYFSYSQIWAIKDNKNLYLSGRTNRAIYSFEQQITKMVHTLTNITS